MKYPRVKVVAKSGECIVVDPRPSPEQLKSMDSHHTHNMVGNVRLSGDYRIPKKDEFYWHWNVDTSHALGCILRSRGKTTRYHHILLEQEPQLAVLDPATGHWVATPVSDIKAMLEDV